RRPCPLPTAGGTSRAAAAAPAGTAAPGRRSSGRLRTGQTQPRPHHPGGSGTKLGLLSQRAPPVPGEPVIAAQPAIVRLLPVGLDQPLGSEPVQHPVQAADLQLHPALRQLLDLTYD